MWSGRPVLQRVSQVMSAQRGPVVVTLVITTAVVISAERMIRQSLAMWVGVSDPSGLFVGVGNPVGTK